MRCSARKGIPFGVAALLALAAAAGARAEENSDGLFSKMLKIIDMKTDTAEPKDFVKQTRPPDEAKKYIPVGRVGPERSVKAKSAAEIKATEAQLDLLRANHENAAKTAPKPTPPSAFPQRPAPSPGN